MSLAIDPFSLKISFCDQSNQQDLLILKFAHCDRYLTGYLTKYPEFDLNEDTVSGSRRAASEERGVPPSVSRLRSATLDNAQMLALFSVKCGLHLKDACALSPATCVMSSDLRR